MKLCPQCRESFRPPSRHPRQRYCSLACRNEGQRRSETVPCGYCGKPVVRKLNRRKRLAHAFCPTDCYPAWYRLHGPKGERHVQHLERVAVPCDTCGASLARLPHQMNRHNFCGVQCREAWQRTSGYSSGTNSPTWRGGFDSYRGPNWRQQRRAALVRDQHTCQRCGATEHLQVHHIHPYVTFASYLDANQLANLTALCPRCHKTVEWEYWRAHPDMPSQRLDKGQHRLLEAISR